jgi:hypothetical protein
MEAIVGVGEQALEDSMEGNELELGDDDDGDANDGVDVEALARSSAISSIKGKAKRKEKEKEKEKERTEANAGSKIKSIYGAPVLMGGAKAKSKSTKAKDPKGSTTGGFNRNSMDAPPNLEMMAKFAVEKEK